MDSSCWSHCSLRSSSGASCLKSSSNISRQALSFFFITPLTGKIIFSHYSLCRFEKNLWYSNLKSVVKEQNWSGPFLLAVTWWPPGSGSAQLWSPQVIIFLCCPLLSIMTIIISSIISVMECWGCWTTFMEQPQPQHSITPVRDLPGSKLELPGSKQVGTREFQDDRKL